MVEKVFASGKWVGTGGKGNMVREHAGCWMGRDDGHSTKTKKETVN